LRARGRKGEMGDKKKKDRKKKIKWDSFLEKSKGGGKVKRKSDSRRWPKFRNEKKKELGTKRGGGQGKKSVLRRNS